MKKRKETSELVENNNFFYGGKDFFSEKKTKGQALLLQKENEEARNFSMKKTRGGKDFSGVCKFGIATPVQTNFELSL